MRVVDELPMHCKYDVDDDRGNTPVTNEGVDGTATDTHTHTVSIVTVTTTQTQKCTTNGGVTVTSGIDVQPHSLCVVVVTYL